MISTYLKRGLLPLIFIGGLWLAGCQGSSVPAGTTTAANRSLAPERVDIRGSIVSSQYSDGQIILEIERLSPSPYSRYDRAFVLVLPTAQMVDQSGHTISISEFRTGQNVAILLRGGGQGNRVGVGTARKIWIEDIF